MSNYTRQRYYRLLRGIYAHACQRRWCSENPALLLGDAQRPSVRARDRQAQVLEPAVFAKLQDPQIIERITPVSSDQDWWHLRDRAILAILVATGITTSELASLKGVDVIDGASQRPLRVEQMSLDGSHEIWIDVMDSSELLGRRLHVAPHLTGHLIQWLVRRRSLLLKRCALGPQAIQPEEYMRQHDEQGAIFVARRALSGGSGLPAMDAGSIYHAVRKSLQALRQILKDSRDERVHVASGAAIIRNSVIQHWLNTETMTNALAMAGLKSETSLRLWANASLQITKRGT